MPHAIVQIPAELFALAESSHFEGELAVEELVVGPDVYSFAQPVSWDAEITNTGAAFLVAGQVTGIGTCDCARCLEPVSFDFAGEIEGYFLIDGSRADDYDDDDDAPGDDEFDVLPDDHRVDLEPLIRAALIVDAPGQPLCREDCAGLCPQCGANLNDGACDCEPDKDLVAFEREANPFSVLADFEFE